MYIEYITPQQVADPNYTNCGSKGGDYRPTWLIRTSDWKKVPGTEATDSYHALSYCWEQSGEKFQKADGEYGLIDNGYHRITTKLLEKRKNRRSTRYRRPTRTKYVSYDKVLQQICKDFDIEYLRYDKICIDQSNKAEKQREIKQMHRIYSNARYTVVLVPEVYIDDPRDFNRVRWTTGHTEAKNKALGQMQKTLWWKRSWTLEEVMMSTRVLVVGRNTHFWSLADSKKDDKYKERDFLATSMLGFTERRLKSANIVLHYSHFRTSTKPHDKVFALANIFNETINIDIDYSIDMSAVANEFYRRLAEKDLSVMCFGANRFEGRLRYQTTMDSHSLRSWTGVAGLHSWNAISNITSDQNCDYTIDDNMQLHVICKSHTIRPTKYNDHDVFKDKERGNKAFENFMEVITSMDDFDGDESEALDWSQLCMLQATYCYATHYHKPDEHTAFLSLILPLSLTEDCDECVILGVVFDSVTEALAADGVRVGYDHDYLSPVAKQSTDGSSYKIIGVVLLKHFKYDEPRPTPQEYMDRMFSSLGSESQAFCIE